MDSTRCERKWLLFLYNMLLHLFYEDSVKSINHFTSIEGIGTILEEFFSNIRMQGIRAGAGESVPFFVLLVL